MRTITSIAETVAQIMIQEIRLQSFDVLVEEIVFRITTHRVMANDVAHGKSLVQFMSQNIPTQTGSVIEKTLRKTVLSPSYATSRDAVHEPGEPVGTVTRLSVSALRAIPGPIIIGHLEVHTAALRVYWRGAPADLGMGHYRMLLELVLHVDIPVVRYELLAAKDHEQEELYDRTCDSSIKRIRRTFEKVDPRVDAITTLYGIGYRIESEKCGVTTPTRAMSHARLEIHVES